MDVVDGVDLRGKVIIVTGGNAGIGVEVVRALYSRGANVVVASRSEKRGNAAIEDIKARTTVAFDDAENELLCMRMDLNDLGSVREFAEAFTKKFERLDVLINNAGIMSLPEWEPTAQGIEKQFGVDHLGHFYLTRLLLPLLVKSGKSRVVCVASRAHQMAPDMAEWISDLEESDVGPLKEKYTLMGGTAYGFAKACNMLHARAIRSAAKRLYGEKADVRAASLHPGAIYTPGLYKHQMMVVKFVCKYALASFWKTPESGAATSTRLATIDHEQVNGSYWRDCAPGDEWIYKEDIKEGAPDLDDRLWAVSEKIIKDKGFALEL
jgi:NAD(P)-dependent dehydrogenase (short-subunit alcohol dehydrogenase family)